MAIWLSHISEVMFASGGILDPLRANISQTYKYILQQDMQS
jgi:hypothetical protein